MKMKVLQTEIKELNNLLTLTDSIPPIEYFGYNFFHLRDSLQIADNKKITSDYILGYGDEIIISVWGQVEQYDKKVIQRDGSIFIANVGLLYLDGMNLLNAKNYIYDRFSKVYSTLSSKTAANVLRCFFRKIKKYKCSYCGSRIISR